MSNTKTFIQENKELIRSIPACSGDMARLCFRLAQANERLEAVVEQANAQFKVGDRYATFSKNFVDNLNVR